MVAHRELHPKFIGKDTCKAKCLEKTPSGLGRDHSCNQVLEKSCQQKIALEKTALLQPGLKRPELYRKGLGKDIFAATSLVLAPSL